MRGPVLREPAHRVSPQAVPFWRVSALIGDAILVVAAVVAYVVVPDVPGWTLALVLLVAAAAIAHVVLMPQIRYRVHRWEVTDTAVHTRSGWIGRETRIAPISRVQTVDSRQGALMRLFGLASITVTTASAAGPITVDCLDADTAREVVARLTAITAAHGGRRHVIPSPGSPGEGWSRLSPRKLLLDPVKAIGQAIVPLVVALVGISQSDSGFGWVILPIAIVAPLLFGALPWLTTHYRLTDTQIQVRSGVLNKNTSTAPLDRVRSVDLEASLLHRVLGLQKVQVGTGVDDDRITLDALAAADAHALRTTLLRRREAPAVVPGSDPDDAEGVVPGAGRGPRRARPDRLVVAALRTLQPRSPGPPGRRPRRALAVRRRPADLERGDRALGVGLGDCSSPSRRSSSSWRSPGSPSGSSCR